MPVPRLIASFVTYGYYADHVGTLQFSSRTSTSARATPLVFLPPKNEIAELSNSFRTTEAERPLHATRAELPTTKKSSGGECDHGQSDEVISANNTFVTGGISCSTSQHQPNNSNKGDTANNNNPNNACDIRVHIASTLSTSPSSSPPPLSSSMVNKAHSQQRQVLPSLPPPLPLCLELPPQTVKRATRVLLTAMKDFSEDAQQAVMELPANTLYFMNPLTREMSAEVIRTIVPRRYLQLYSSEVTPAPLDSYLHQLFTLFSTSPEEIIIALVLVAKLSTRIPICTLSVARVFLTAMVVASKLRADERTAMRVYATFGGVGVADLLGMERSFLTALGFNAGVRPESFIDMLYSLRQYCVHLVDEGCDWAAAVWADFAPRIAIPDIRHLDSMPEKATDVITCEGDEGNAPTTG